MRDTRTSQDIERESTFNSLFFKEQYINHQPDKSNLHFNHLQKLTKICQIYDKYISNSIEKQNNLILTNKVLIGIIFL